MKKTTRPTRAAFLSDAVLHAEAGIPPKPPELAERLNVLWPVVDHALDGTWSMPDPEEAQRLDSLFELFGVTVRTTNAPLKALEHAYTVCGLGLAGLVEQRVQFPKLYADDSKGWPQDWLDYIDAAANLDLVATKRLAASTAAG